MMTRTSELLTTSGAQSPGTSAKTILLVDDQKDERAIQRVLLEHLGYRVWEAADGEVALEIAREISPDLVLLDIAIPKVDGLEVCRAIRADEQTAHAAILFYTASAEGESDERLSKVGCNGVLIKPREPKDVAEAIENLIGPA
jgi:CheY-like chemotaxis protein